MARRRPHSPPPGMRRNLIRAADVEPEELEFLWLDRIPLGVITLIGGRPGQGKSLFTTYLAAEVTRAGGAVIMSNPEDPIAAIKVPRLLAAGADARMVHFWPGKLRLPHDVDELEEFVAFHGVKLVTIDPIAKHVQGKDPNTALEALAAMAERRKIAVVGVHHLNKRLPKDAHPQEAFGGASGGWLGTVRVAHVLGPTGSGEAEDRFLAPAKMNYAPLDVPAIQFYLDEAEVDLPTGGVTESERLIYSGDAAVSAHAVVQFRGDEVGQAKDGQTEKRAVATEFLTLLLMKGPQAAGDVYEEAKKVQVSKMTIKRASLEMGIVKERQGFGKGSWIRWRLPDSHPLMKQIGPPVSEPLADVDAAIDQILGEAEDGDE